MARYAGAVLQGDNTMSDPNNHEFLPNRLGKCKQVVGSSICHLPEDAPAHVRWADSEANPPAVAAEVEEDDGPWCGICGKSVMGDVVEVYHQACVPLPLTDEEWEDAACRVTGTMRKEWLPDTYWQALAAKLRARKGKR